MLHTKFPGNRPTGSGELCCKFAEKKMIYNTNVDLVNDSVYTNFGLILSIRSQDIE